ncbi:hypothetical protein QQS21_009369 [Conoideocrella luteorostrata]|uniref:G-protein coupled receptors family 2 profile 2 domain-containing protein n=1 Tax=Conoideocrella luteorostrata TaxID=1105319 RepID=A0AAJ0CJR7_9HYPO|nr:hypothetical protein QQS21_009369 [Conoideocrella luteorostrata]
MAINVYLTFYLKFDSKRLRKMEVPYLIACYGIPAIPAIAFLFIKNSEGKRVYGNATLWCWISNEWDILRIVMFYGPVWVIIFITMFIYLRAGRTIYEKRKQLQDFHSSDPDPLSVNGEAITTIKTTEVTVTTEVADERGIRLNPIDRRDMVAGPSSRGPNGVYSVHITAESQPNTMHVNDEATQPMQSTAIQQKSSTQPINPRRTANIARRRNHELNNAAWSYTKCAILFFTAILITWIPSSANRVYSLVHKGDVSIPLEFLSAFVLPLQGFWNAVIYATTSWSACLDFFHTLKLKKPSAAAEHVGTRRHNEVKTSSPQRRRNQFRSPTSSRTFESDSTTELAKTRTPSADGSRRR